MFADRADAGRQLATALARYAEVPGGIVLALPRGGVVVGYEISRALRLPVEVFIVRKIGYPGNPECACAAIGETGVLTVTQECRETLGSTSSYLAHASTEQLEEIERRKVLYRHGRALPDMTGRTVILVDDGLATGATFEAAIHAVRRLMPTQLIGAVPVAPPDTVKRLRTFLADLVVLVVPEGFMAVGEAYQDFHQVDDNDVLRLLNEAQREIRPQN
jgi:putative phosphoribosyl transferase